MSFGREPAPDQRARLSKIYRLQAVLFAVLALAGIAIGVFAAERRRTGAAWLDFAFAAAWTLLAFLSWSRSRRSR